MRSLSVKISGALLLVLLCACSKEEEKTTFSAQESRIESYVNSELKAHEEYSMTNNGGSVRIVMREGSGEALEKNGVISFHYAAYIFTGSSISPSNLFATNDEDSAIAAKWETSNPEQFKILTLNLAETDLVEGLANGLTGVKGGEECMILFSGKHGFGKKQLGTIPANSALAYHIWVESVSNN